MRFGLDLWNPERGHLGREMTSFEREMNRFFDQFTSQLPRSLATRNSDFMPSCDVEETDNHYVLKIDVPGFRKENLKVELTDNVLTVAGEYRDEKRDEKKTQRMNERVKGYFERSFQLPHATESAKVEASYADGVLHIAVPKTAATKTKQIPIGEGRIAIKGSMKTGEGQKPAVAA